MSIGKVITATAVALTMAGSPVLAQAVNPASKLSVANAAQASRAGATMSGESHAAGSTLILGLAGLFAVGALVFIVADDDDEPASP